MSDKILKLVEQQLAERGWSMREFARRAGLSPTTISDVLSDKYNPGFDFCVGVARALKIPEIDVLRMAGMLPQPKATDEDVTELSELAKMLNAEHRKTLYEIASGFYAAEQHDDK